MNNARDTRNPSFANAFFLKIIQEKYLCFSKYFTDGSKSDTGVGAAAFIEEENISLHWRLDTNHSIVIAELYTIYRCLQHVAESSTHKFFVIFTD